MNSMGAEVHRLLKASRLRPNQRLGQHFLVSEKAAGRILESAQLKAEDVVCEIGCGLGVLTRRIAERVSKVIALEIDRGLAETAGRVCRDLPVEVVHTDVLEADPEAWFPPPTVVMGNLPYYLTAPIVKRLVEWKAEARLPLRRAILMVQREVADRMMAEPGGKTFGSFSVFVQYWMEAARVCAVPPGAFFPVPDVGSAVMALTFRASPPVAVKDPEWFFKVVRTAFRQRRKMLRQSLREMGGLLIQEACERAGVSPMRRPEQMGIEEFARLADAML